MHEWHTVTIKLRIRKQLQVRGYDDVRGSNLSEARYGRHETISID